MNRHDRIAGFDFRRTLGGAGLALAAALAAGCQGLPPMGGDNIVARDVLEIKHLMEAQKEESASSQRKIEYRLDTLSADVQTRTELIKNNVEDIDKSSRQQAEEIAELRKQLQGLRYEIAALTNKPGGGMAAGAAPAMPGAPGQPALAGGGTAAASAAPISPEDAYADADREYNLGRYDSARKKLEALVASPDLSSELFVKGEFLLGESCFALDDVVPAFEHYRRAIDNRNGGRGNPAHTLAWRSLERMAMINQKQGRSAEALKLYDQILSKNPGYEGTERVKERVKELRAAEAATAPSSTAPSPAPAAQP